MVALTIVWLPIWVPIWAHAKRTTTDSVLSHARIYEISLVGPAEEYRLWV